MVEQQPYTVVRRHPGFELRHYPEHVLAEVEIRGSFEEAGSSAFRVLFDYISGNNRGRHEIAMTAPVLQGGTATREAPERIAMTAPVWQRGLPGDAARHAVAFVLPRSLTAATAPVPEDPVVRIRTEPATLAAAVRYRGRWARSTYEEHRRRLEDAVRAAGLTPTGPARFARFDPPFKPPFLRRNEVVLPVSDSGAPGAPPPR
jgi:hypothetical protein